MSRSTTPPPSRQNTYSARRLAVATAFAASTIAVTTRRAKAAAMGKRGSSRAQTEYPRYTPSRTRKTSR